MQNAWGIHSTVSNRRYPMNKPVIFTLVVSFISVSLPAFAADAGAPGVGLRRGVGAGAPGLGLRRGVGVGAPGIGLRRGAGAGAPGLGLRRGVGVGAPGIGVRPGLGAGAPGVGLRRGVGVGAPGVGVRPGVGAGAPGPGLTRYGPASGANPANVNAARQTNLDYRQQFNQKRNAFNDAQMQNNPNAPQSYVNRNQRLSERIDANAQHLNNVDNRVDTRSGYIPQ